MKIIVVLSALAAVAFAAPSNKGDEIPINNELPDDSKREKRSPTIGLLSTQQRTHGHGHGHVEVLPVVLGHHHHQTVLAPIHHPTPVLYKKTWPHHHYRSSDESPETEKDHHDSHDSHSSEEQTHSTMMNKGEAMEQENDKVMSTNEPATPKITGNLIHAGQEATKQPEINPIIITQENIKHENIQQQGMKQEEMKQETINLKDMKQEEMKQENIDQDGMKQEIKQKDMKQEDSLQDKITIDNNRQPDVKEEVMKQSIVDDEHITTENTFKTANIETEKFEEIEKNAMDSSKPEDLEIDIGSAKAAVEDLQRDLKEFENVNARMQWKSSDQNKDLTIQDNITKARAALAEVQKSFDDLEHLNKNIQHQKDAGEDNEEAELERMAQWKDTLENIHKNINIATSIDESLSVSDNNAKNRKHAELEPSKCKAKQSNNKNTEIEMETSASEPKVSLLKPDGTEDEKSHHSELKNAINIPDKEHESMQSETKNERTTETEFEPVSKEKTSSKSIEVVSHQEKIESSETKPEQVTELRSSHSVSSFGNHNHDHTQDQEHKQKSKLSLVSENQTHKSIDKKITEGKARHVEQKPVLNNQMRSAEQITLIENEMLNEGNFVSPNSQQNMDHHHARFSGSEQEHNFNVPEQIEMDLGRNVQFSPQKPVRHPIEKAENTMQPQLSVEINNDRPVQRSQFEMRGDASNTHEVVASAQPLQKKEQQEVIDMREAFNSWLQEKSADIGKPLKATEMRTSALNTHSLKLKNEKLSAPFPNMSPVNQQRSFSGNELKDLHGSARGAYGLGGYGASSSGLSIGSGANAGYGSSGGAIGVFPNANLGGCAVPLLLSCSPSVVSGSLAKTQHAGYSAPASHAAISAPSHTSYGAAAAQAYGAAGPALYRAGDNVKNGQKKRDIQKPKLKRTPTKYF